MYIYICFGGVGSHLQLLDPDLRKKLLLPETENNTESETAKPNWKCSLYGRKKKTAAFVFAFVVLFFWATTPLQPDRPTPGDLVSFFLPYFRAFLCAFSSISGFGVGRKLNN